MRRNATLSLDDLDPDVLDAARDVARRAGVPLATWIESVVGPEPKGRAPDPLSPSPQAPAAGERRRRKRDVSDEGSARLVHEAPPAATPRPERNRPNAAASSGQDWSGTVGASIGEMMRRLDALDGALSQQRKGSDDAAAKAIERLETRIASALDAKPAGEMVERLADIERRMSELSTSLSGPRPLGRRGRPLAAEMRDAVEQIRQRQRELDAGDAPVAAPAASPVLTDLQLETSRLRESLSTLATGRDLGALQEAMRTLASDVQSARVSATPEPSPAITDLQLETSRLRETLGSLATGRHVGALEEAMRTLASDVQRARAPSDIAAIAEPIALIRGQVDRLADEVADNVHSRISGEVARLATKVEGALSSQPSSNADRGALDSVFRELDEIRRLIGALAGPERIQGLAQGLQSISAQISQLQGGISRGAPSVDELRPLLEEIRRDLKAPDASKAILGRIDALADKMERASANPVGDLIGRLDDIGERLRRPAPQDGELANIQKMLRGLAEKVDHVGAAGGGQGLDALEKQVVAIARRLDARGADPAVAGLERMMQELLGQVSALREGSPVEAAVERATRRALAEMPRSDQEPAGSGFEQMRADLAEFGSRHVAADQRIQATLGNLNAVLERLVERLDRPVASDERPLAERLSASISTAAITVPVQAAAEPAPQALQIRRPEAPRAAAPEALRADELLEPGASRPRPNRSPTTDPAKPTMPGGDIKANFIAAARRAAQAAQAEIETPAASERRSERARGRVAGETSPAAQVSGQAAGSLVTRLRGEFDRRRKPLLLGLASVVLMLGAYQAFDLGGGEPAPETAPPVATNIPPAAPAPKLAEAPPAIEPAPQAPAAKPAVAEPQTTQSITPPAPSHPTVASTAIPKVAGMDALKADLASVPTALSSLRQAALDGDGTAVFELASREAEGRGVTRDLGIAAKLYEKLAEAGYAPAQFKLGGAYEKGSGVVRNLDQAKLWYGRAAEHGNVRSMHNLAVIHAENPAANGKPDFATASTWFRRAAEYGVRDSQYNLAVLYARGLGVNQDLIQSYGWFSAAAAQGDEEAGKKRDDVAAKLSPKDLATAKAAAAAFKPKLADPAVNEVPAAKAAANAPMSLLGAPVPGSPSANGFTPTRPAPRPGSTGV